MFLRTLIFVAAITAGLILADVVNYTYDDAGRLTSVTYPNGAAIAYTYDAAGNLTARTVTGATASARKPQREIKVKAAEEAKPEETKSGQTDSKSKPDR